MDFINFSCCSKKCSKSSVSAHVSCRFQDLLHKMLLCSNPVSMVAVVQILVNNSLENVHKQDVADVGNTPRYNQ